MDAVEDRSEIGGDRMGKDFDHTQGLVLERHRSRRLQGVPTLSVLIGDDDVARWCWSRWQAAAALPFVCSDAATWHGLLTDWLSPVAVPRHGGSAALVSAVSSENADALASWVRAGYPSALSELASMCELPGLLLCAPRAATAGALCELLGNLLGLSELLPRLELACILSEAQLVRWRQEAEPRQLERIKEGLIRLEPAPDAPDVQARGSRRRPRSGEHLRALASDEAEGHGIPRLEYDADEFARSRARRALFEHLQARPRTQGLFTLDATIAEPLAAHALEVDLLSEPLGVALEIDGHRQFRDADAYRRDRDEDLLLQRLGYTVVRVLASDVETELARVTDTIDQVLEHQRRRRTG